MIYNQGIPRIQNHMRFVVLSGLTVFLNSCLPLSEEPTQTAMNWQISYERISSQGSANVVSIQNIGPESASFLLKWNGVDMSSMDGLLEVISQYAPQEPTPHIQAWRFVHDFSQHYSPLTERKWLHEPVLFFNSAGFGICDDLAELLYHVWTAMGYEARIWSLNGHIVPEVFAQGKWQLLDPDFGTYYLNDGGEIASVNEIAQDPSLIFNPRLVLDSYLSSAYSPGVAALYASTGDNRFCSSNGRLSVKCDPISRSRNGGFFQIPGQSTLELPHQSEGYLTYDPDVAEIPDFKIAILKIAPGVSGRINIPLIPVSATGSGTVRTSRGNFVVGARLDQYFAERTGYNPSMWVDAGDEGMEITFSLNPRIFNTEDFAGLILQSDRPDLLNVSDSLGTLMMTSVEFVVD